jgi:hypothetical protein
VRLALASPTLAAGHENAPTASCDSNRHVPANEPASNARPKQAPPTASVHRDSRPASDGNKRDTAAHGRNPGTAVIVCLARNSNVVREKKRKTADPRGGEGASAKEDSASKNLDAVLAVNERARIARQRRTGAPLRLRGSPSGRRQQRATGPL